MSGRKPRVCRIREERCDRRIDHTKYAYLELRPYLHPAIGRRASIPRGSTQYIVKSSNINGT